MLYCIAFLLPPYFTIGQKNCVAIDHLFLLTCSFQHKKMRKDTSYLFNFNEFTGHVIEDNTMT